MEQKKSPAEQTKTLLREVLSGAKYATNSMEQLLPYLPNGSLRDTVRDCDTNHAKIGESCAAALRRRGLHESEPHPMVRRMAKAGTSMKVAMDATPHHIAVMLYDGTAKGIKSLSRYRNRHPYAAPEAVALCNQLIREEQAFMASLTSFL